MKQSLILLLLTFLTCTAGANECRETSCTENTCIEVEAEKTNRVDVDIYREGRKIFAVQCGEVLVMSITTDAEGCVSTTLPRGKFYTAKWYADNETTEQSEHKFFVPLEGESQ